jgi:hypothetical protein
MPAFVFLFGLFLLGLFLIWVYYRQAKPRPLWPSDRPTPRPPGRIEAAIGGTVSEVLARFIPWLLWLIMIAIALPALWSLVSLIRWAWTHPLF